MDRPNPNPICKSYIGRTKQELSEAYPNIHIVKFQVNKKIAFKVNPIFVIETDDNDIITNIRYENR